MDEPQDRVERSDGPAAEALDHEQPRSLGELGQGMPNVVLSVEQALRAEAAAVQGQLAAILAGISDAVVAIDRSWRYTFVSDQAETLLGRPREALVAQQVWELFPESVGSTAYAQLQRAMTERVPTSFEDFNPVLGRWYENRAQPSDAGLTIFFSDVTERKRAEQVIATAAARDTFRLTLADALRPLTDPIALQAQATAVLGRYLGANRVAYFEVDGDDYVAERYYSDGVESPAGRFSSSSFGARQLALYRAGRTVVEPDVAGNPELTPAEQATYASYGIATHVGVPLVKDGQFVAGLAVHSTTPRAWTHDEVALIEETAERTWAAVERARAEAALRESEQHFRLMADTIPQAIWLVDHDGHVEFLNKWWADYCGVAYEPSTAAEMAASLLHPDDGPMVMAAFERARHTGTMFEVEQRNRSASGEYRWFLNRAVPYRDPQSGAIVRWFGVGVDIHDRKLQEQDTRLLSELGELLRTSDAADQLLAAATALIGRHLGLGRCCFVEIDEVNDRWLVTQEYYKPSLAPLAAAHRLTEYPFLDELRAGSTVLSADAKHDPNTAAVYGSALAPLAICAFVVVPFRVQERWAANLIATSEVARRWEAREVALLETVAEWVWLAVEKLRADAALRERERDARFVAELAERIWQAEDAALLVSEAVQAIGGYFGVSRCYLAEIFEDDDRWTIEQEYHVGLPAIAGAYSLTAYGDEVLRMSRAGTLIVVDDTERHPLSAAVYATQYAPLGFRSFVNVPLLRSGRWVSALVVSVEVPRPWLPREVALIESIARRVWLAVEKLRGDAALRASEARLQTLYAREQAARKQAEEASRLKDEFLATVSHELRTPLTAFLGYTQLLQSRKRDEAYVARTIEKMRRSAEAQAQLIEDLLDVSRIVSGKLRLEPQEFDLAEVVYAAVDAVRPAIDAKGLRLQLLLDEPNGSVIGDPSRLQQVVWNLLSNAAKFTRAGGRITVALEGQDKHVQLVVSDTGQGISPAFLPYVFERFRQEESTSTRSYGGLGLGLAIVRHLVEMHGGTVQAESAGEGKGATFVVALPRRFAAGDSGGAAAEEGAAGEGGLPAELAGLRILVVDDQPLIAALIAETLGEHGAEVRSRNSARAALNELRAWRPDLLLSDIAMPGEDGYWLIRELRALPPEAGGDTPAIALTAFVRVEDRARVLEAGFQFYVPKPIQPDELCAVVAQVARAAALE